MTRKRSSHILRDYGIAIGGAIFLAFGIRYFLVEAYRMPSRAMTPAVEAGDTLFVSKKAYGWRIPFSAKRFGGGRPPEYGDVVVLEFGDEPGRQYIKRIAGRPGDRVQLKNGHLILNGQDRSQANIDSGLCGKETLPNDRTYTVCWEPPVLANSPEWTLKNDEFFVVGDLRSEPPEARRLTSYGRVTLAGIRGRASFIWLSVNTPGSRGGGGDWFSRIRFDRLFKRIE